MTTVDPTPVTDESAGARRGWTGYALLTPGSIWLTLFFVVPLVTLVSTSLYDPGGTLETGYQLTFEFANYANAIADNAEEFLRSLLFAGISTLLCLVLGYPLAYAIAFKAGRWKNLLLVLVIAPFFTSFLIRTLSWKFLLGDTGILHDALGGFQIFGNDPPLLYTSGAVILGLTYNFLPFMVLPLYASLEKIDHRLIEAASDLYATPVQGFRRVTLPLSMPGVVSGTLLTFIPAAGDFINAELLGTPNQTMIGNRIQSEFSAGAYPEAAALSVTLMILILAMVLYYIRRSGTEELV